jgi:hypothetical protein
VDWWIGGLVDRWIGGSVNRWIGGLVDWWIGYPLLLEQRERKEGWMRSSRGGLIGGLVNRIFLNIHFHSINNPAQTALALVYFKTKNQLINCNRVYSAIILSLQKEVFIA